MWGVVIWGGQVEQFLLEEFEVRPPDGLEEAGRLRWCWRHWPKGEPTVTGTKGERVLVVVDNVEAYKGVVELLPKQSGRFDVVLTSRRVPVGRVVQELSLEELLPDDALALLAVLVGEERVVRERGVAEEICGWLGYLPLGLELVGTFLGQSSKQDMPLAAMLEELKGKSLTAQALVEVEDAGMTAQLGVAAAFEVTWGSDCLGEEAQQLACLLSVFGAAPVPWGLVDGMVPEEQKEVMTRARDDQLFRYHLLQRVEEGIYRLHPLIREFLQAKLELREDAAELKGAVVGVLVLLARKVPQALTIQQVPVFALVLPHWEEVIERLLGFVGEDDFVWPFVAIAKYYYGQGLYKSAETWFSRCHTQTVEKFGDKHPDVATSLNNLAGLYESQGKYEQAEPRYVEALQLSRELLGDKHPDVATSLNNLAGLYQAQGKYEQAEPRYVEALQLSRELLGDKHPDVATSLNNLAGLYQAQGKYEQAEPRYVEALQLRRELLGDKHPDVATSLNNLAGLYRAQGKYEQAEPRYVEALQLRRELLGDKHPDVATSLNNLAGLYRAQGKYEQAEPRYVEALQLRRELLGDKHPDVATSLNNLAGLYESQGKYEQALVHYQEALPILQDRLGPQHPTTITVNQNYQYCQFQAQIAQLLAIPQIQDLVTSWGAPTDPPAFFKQLDTDPQLQQNLNTLLQSLSNQP